MYFYGRITQHQSETVNGKCRVIPNVPPSFLLQLLPCNSINPAQQENKPLESGISLNTSDGGCGASSVLAASGSPWKFWERAHLSSPPATCVGLEGGPPCQAYWEVNSRSLECDQFCWTLESSGWCSGSVAARPRGCGILRLILSQNSWVYYSDGCGTWGASLNHSWTQFLWL